jgi:hypothetical protein
LCPGRIGRPQGLVLARELKIGGVRYPVGQEPIADGKVVHIDMIASPDA